MDTDRVRAIVEESARYNIGNIPRNINTPMLPLVFLQENFQYRFKFKRTRNASPDLAGLILAGRGDNAAFRTEVEVWVIEYRETRDGHRDSRHRRATISRAPGRYWIEPDTGAVLMSELVMEKGDVRAVIDVSYQSEPLLGLRVPVAMHERYRARSDRVEGIATLRQVPSVPGEDRRGDRQAGSGRAAAGGQASPEAAAAFCSSASCASRSLYFWILPDAVIGNASTSLT